MKTVIIATDFSNISNNACGYAASALVGKDYTLVLFYLYNPSIHVLNAQSSAATFDHMLGIQKDKLDMAAGNLKKLYNHSITTYLATGNFQEELQHCIELHQADMVVMGMAGKSFDQDLLGNATTAPIHRLKFPVLAIPEGAAFRGFKRFLFAVDMLRGVHRQVLARVRQLASDFGATVEVFHVRQKIEEIQETEEIDHHLETIKSQFQGIHYTYRNVTSQKIVSSIRDEISNGNYDLLIMVPQRYGFWESAVHRSKTRMMASGIDIPLLSLPL